MKIKDVLDALEEFAPLPLQESYDNAGLQVGLTEVQVSGALLCLDINEKIIDEAINLGCNLIVSHHPLIFHKLSKLTAKSMVERCIIKAIKHDITIVSMHTNIDNAQGGVNYKIAEKLNLKNIRTLGKTKTIEVTSNNGNTKIVQATPGIIGEPSSPLAADDFIIQIKRTFGVECVMCNQLIRREIKKIAVCGGAGSFLLKDAITANADAFITGEMHYHDYFGYEQIIQIAVIGHYQSEQFTNELFKSIIQEKCKGVKCYLAKTNTNPIIYL